MNRVKLELVSRLSPDQYGMGKYAQFLRRKRKKRQDRSHKKKKREIIQNRVGIEERGDTSDFGHWEIDTVVGKNHQGGIITAVEKKSKF